MPLLLRSPLCRPRPHHALAPSSQEGQGALGLPCCLLFTLTRVHRGSRRKCLFSLQGSEGLLCARDWPLIIKSRVPQGALCSDGVLLASRAPPSPVTSPDVCHSALAFFLYLSL